MSVVTRNEGQRVVSTTYWAQPPAAAGFLHLSVNAGALRMIVPDATSYLLDDLPEVGTGVHFVRRPGQVGEVCRFVWDDDPESPYVVELDVRQVDRPFTPGPTPRGVPLIWHRQDGDDGVVEVRREMVELRR